MLLILLTQGVDLLGKEMVPRILFFYFVTVFQLQFIHCRYFEVLENFFMLFQFTLETLTTVLKGGVV